jgi:hypothetical protein
MKDKAPLLTIRRCRARTWPYNALRELADGPKRELRHRRFSPVRACAPPTKGAGLETARRCHMRLHACAGKGPPRRRHPFVVSSVIGVVSRRQLLVLKQEAEGEG